MNGKIELTYKQKEWWLFLVITCYVVFAFSQIGSNIDNDNSWKPNELIYK